MSRGLDHAVHAVRDLDRGAELYRRLGFTVGARNRHPWGTHNHIVQVAGGFIEILTLAEPERLGADGLSREFGVFHQNFLARGEGLSFLVLESADAAADAAAFAREGIACSPVLDFSREATRADGTGVTVGFSLALARDPLSPAVGFAACRQLKPENFWNAALQSHANTACGLAGAVLIAENPTDHHAFLSSFSGVRALHATSSGVSAVTARGAIEIMDPTAFRDHFGVAHDVVGAGLRFAALRIGVADPARAAACFAAGGIEAANQRGRLVVAPSIALGATLVFEQATGG
ncbi:MAG: VOC family protein [Xanthobacteraceae bacterium]|nr:MAG: VOC family protein [Xanthobacteraceae bacterium]